MFGRYAFELSRSAEVLVREMFRVKGDETFILTADTESDMRVVEATAGAVFAAGAKPMVILTPAPLGVGKAADPLLPVDALAAALAAADAWVEFNNQWLLYSTPYERAMKANKKLRYMCLVGMNVDMMVRVIGRVAAEPLARLLKKITEMTRKAVRVRITTPAGTEVVFENNPDWPFSCDTGDASRPGVHMLSGQIGWCPKFETIQGSIVFDGSLVPPIGLLDEPVRLTVKEGRIVELSGGKEADAFRQWLRDFDDENMWRMAHVCYGFNPGARLTGNILEDERVWGCTEWGIGYVSPADAPPRGIPAPSHTDGICLRSSVWLDGVQLLEQGRIVQAELKALAAAVPQSG